MGAEVNWYIDKRFESNPLEVGMRDVEWEALMKRFLPTLPCDRRFTAVLHWHCFSNRNFSNGA